ncbi:MAG: TolC family protein, partial [Bacteroidetes bacterium]|nr:TolC family protein [Bacteroidota bacterium]
MNKLLLFSLLLFCFQTHAQVLDEYVEYGLESNLAIKQKEADYRKSLLVLKEAKGLFYPTITLDARYSLSTGGRIIEFPIGDLLNPVYANLNNLYQLHGFPTDPPIVLDNEEFP